VEALDEQRAAVVLIGAQAIYLHTGGAPVALAETTKDTDLAIDPRVDSQVPLGLIASKENHIGITGTPVRGGRREGD
jgi:hypothetical protein